MRKLYFTNEAFVCRKCLNLGYTTQRKMPSKRCDFMKDKLEKKLKEKGGSTYEKPKYMKRAKFEKIVDRCIDYEIRSEKELKKEMLEWYPNKRGEIEMLF